MEGGDLETALGAGALDVREHELRTRMVQVLDQTRGRSQEPEMNLRLRRQT